MSKPIPYDRNTRRIIRRVEIKVLYREMMLKRLYRLYYNRLVKAYQDIQQYHAQTNS